MSCSTSSSGHGVTPLRSVSFPRKIPERSSWLLSLSRKKTKKTCWLVKVKILFGIKWFKLELFRISAPAASQMVLINGLCIHLHWQLSTLANNPGNTQLSLLVTGSNDSGESYMRRRHVSPHAACALLPPDHRGVSGFQSCKWLVPGIQSVWTGAGGGGGRKGTSSES